MDSFNEKHHAWFEFQTLAVELPQSCHKVIFRHLDSLTGKELEYILLQVLMINGIKVIEVKRAIRK